MTEHIKTPELRFSNFLDMWHIHKLSDVATITGGGTPSTKVSEYWDGEIDWYTPNEIGERIYARGSKKKITNLGYKKSSTKLLPINTILFTSRAGIGNTAILAKEGCTNQGFQSIIPNSEKIDSYFIYTISNHIKKYALKHAAGSTFLEISGKELGKMKLFLPSLTEQQKIGVFFSKLDRQIELEEEKLELLEQQKRGYMQKIFSQELRFKDANGNSYPKWEQKKIDDVANYRRGSFPQPYGKREWYDEINGEPFVQVVDVNKNMKLHNQTKQKISNLAKPKSVKGFIGDIVVTLQGSIGRVAILQYDAYIDRTLLLINSFKTEMNKDYFKYVLYLLFLKEKERAPGGTIKTITKTVLSNFKIDVPIIEEQEKIGNLFNALDKNIEIQGDKVNFLKQRKKGLLQKMFV